MRNRILNLLPACLLLACACRQGPDFDAYRVQILKLHRSFINAHLAEDPSLLVEAVSEEYLFVSKGEILNMVPDDVEKNLVEYFDATTFSVYRDLRDPIIGFSNDGSVAWSIVNVRVAGTRDVGQGAEDPFDIQWAWITLYERRGDEWIRIVDVSTDKAFDENS